MAGHRLSNLAVFCLEGIEIDFCFRSFDLPLTGWACLARRSEEAVSYTPLLMSSNFLLTVFLFQLSFPPSLSFYSVQPGC